MNLQTFLAQRLVPDPKLAVEYAGFPSCRFLCHGCWNWCFTVLELDTRFLLLTVFTDISLWASLFTRTWTYGQDGMELGNTTATCLPSRLSIKKSWRFFLGQRTHHDAADDTKSDLRHLVWALAARLLPDEASPRSTHEAQPRYLSAVHAVRSALERLFRSAWEFV